MSDASDPSLSLRDPVGLYEDPIEVITFAEYLERVRQRPHIADLAHRRIWRMIVAEGEQGPDGRPYPFFSRELYGLDRTIQALVDQYFRPAAMGMEVRKRIVLLVGPVSGGKSTIVTLLKRGLERFTRTAEGELWAIDGCPMHEEPLHLIPDAMRPAMASRLGVVIEGDLCPWCQFQLRHSWNGQRGAVRVRRIALSERMRRGIGTYAPSDPKSQDIADLTGSLDFAAISTYGSESDPRAFRFDGELNIANRGLMEFQEMLKLDEKFLYHLLALSQEGNFKTGRYQLISADEVLIGHTNEAEFRAFSRNPRSEALLSRLLVIPVPYPLELEAEVRVYRKLLAPHLPPQFHLGERALEAAAAVAVLSRLSPDPRPGHDRLSQLEAVQQGDYDPERTRGAGFSGLDPRYIVNRLSAEIAARTDCLDGLDVLDSLWRGIAENPFVDPKQVDTWKEVMAEAKTFLDRRLEHDVLKSFARHWQQHLEDLYQNYVDHVIRWVLAARGESGGQPPADERLLGSVEARMGIPEAQRPEFREELFVRWHQARERRLSLSYLDHPGMRAALEQKLFDDLRDAVKITAQTAYPDPATLADIERAVAAMTAEGPYCPKCAARAVSHIGELLNR
ncbi:MAG: protein prkA [Firmicutes bacterium]|nr:protein prkA [Alicyclobacillaceae bacterium]MCL6496460.1 protein prkA [Bacillota bacterium]